MNMVAYRSDQTPSGAALGLKGKLLMMNKTSRVWPLQGPASFTSKVARMLYLPGPLTCFCHAPSHLSALADASFLADCFVLVAVPTVLIQSFSAQWRSPPLYSFTNSPLPGKTEPLLSFIFYVFFFFSDGTLHKCACHPCAGARLISVSFQFGYTCCRSEQRLTPFFVPRKRPVSAVLSCLPRNVTALFLIVLWRNNSNSIHCTL